MDKLTKKKLLIINLGLLLVNSIIAIILFNLDTSTYEHLDGTEIEPQSSELLWTIIRAQLISIPILSFLIGLIVAAFVDKDLRYSNRIVRSFLLTLAAIYLIETIMGIVKIITFL